MLEPVLQPLLTDLFRNLSLRTPADLAFVTRLSANSGDIYRLYQELYGDHPSGTAGLKAILDIVVRQHRARPEALKKRDEEKPADWFLSHDITGMSLYTDRFCGTLSQLPAQLPYLQELGVNFVHLMPLFESPEGESDGGYAVSNFRRVDPRFGTNEALETVVDRLHQQDMYLMLDIVLNHTSHRHEWAEKAKAGDPFYQQFYYTYPDRTLPNEMEQHMPEIFPESAPGSFTWVPEMQQWVMSVFHQYQWDLNFRNPQVLAAMLDTILWYGNLGVDLLRIDAPAFIWKQAGTNCQNLPQAHTLLRLIKLCVQAATPGMALLGEAIVAPADILPYFGSGRFLARECDVAYNATQMAVQWDALATGEVKVMLAAQPVLQQKPLGTTWISYTRCHDDIGLGYSNEMIAEAGYEPGEHRRFMKDFYAGIHPYSFARGALFSVNPKTNDARISGSLASLCGLESALSAHDAGMTDLAIKRISLMQAMSLLCGGIPMIFYGDELGTTNDYSYLNDAGKSYDNRWMHRPLLTEENRAQRLEADFPAGRIFRELQALIRLRRSYFVFSDTANLRWLEGEHRHIAVFSRYNAQDNLVCMFNFSGEPQQISWYALRALGLDALLVQDLVKNTFLTPGRDDQFFPLTGYQYLVLQAVDTKG